MQRFTSAGGEHVHSVAADRYADAGQSQKQKAALEEAGRDARGLEGVPAPNYVMTRVSYSQRMGDSEAVLKELDQDVKNLAEAQAPAAADVLSARHVFVSKSRAPGTNLKSPPRW